MLEVKDLKKIYKGKKGADVHALDGVSLKFPEKGMVFLLGKSGSGKSTLLNVCGGLDSPTSGEIVVKGRSSKSFSGSDFDSYRNTYVGFIFQEYNILNEFSVEDNIALAIELQGKSKRKRKKEIRELLEQVDLKGYARRKPNTLSGGQKQRIAIARALVKNPEIIMADEPTGALDSNTGKQVLDTLKKLSETKLVIVVSHDREFAETYADRIIELKDGKVISDVSKTAIEQTALSDNLSEVDNVLCIKKGTELTDDELEKIKRFLKDSPEDVIIAKNDTDVKAFKKASRIKDDGSKEVFSKTDEESIEKREYTPKERKFIRSKLPLRHAIKIGVSGMKRKPVRLLLTVLLCTVAFIMFGVLSTLSFYNSEAIFKESLPKSGVSVLTSYKSYIVNVTDYDHGKELFSYERPRQTLFSDSDIEEMKTKYGVDVFGGMPIRWEMNVKNLKSSYWTNEILYAAYLPEGHSFRDKLILGNYPAGNKEIAISKYTAEMLVDSGFYSADGRLAECGTLEDVIGKRISISSNVFTVVGIFDSGEINSKYDVLKSSDDPLSAEKLYAEFVNVLSDGTHLMVFTSEETIESLVPEFNMMYSNSNDYQNLTSALYVTGNNELMFNDWTNAVYTSETKSNATQSTSWFVGKTALGDNEVILPFELFYQFIAENVEAERNARPEKADEINKVYELAGYLMIGGRIWDEETGTVIEFTDEERKQTQAELIEAIADAEWKLVYGFKLRTPYGDTYNYGDELPRFEVVGINYNNRSGEVPKVVFNDNTYKKVWAEHMPKIDFYSEETSEYTVTDDAKYGTVFLPYDGTKNFTDMCWKLYENKDKNTNGIRIAISSSFIDTLEMVDNVVKIMSTVFMWVGIVLAVFAALLFSNFISTSISYKKRDIGILRAVGARGFDVFKIFFSESAIISIVCTVISTASSILICKLINAQLSKGLGISLFVFGPASFFIMVGIACLTAVVATFLPVFNAARKKPVDSIRSI